MIVNAQPTIDGDIEKDPISILIDIVTELRAEQSRSAARIGKLEDEIAKLKGQSAATSTMKPDASKLSRLPLHSPDCVTFGYELSS